MAIARFRKDPAATRDPLFTATLARRSYKKPFDTSRTVSADALAGLLAVGQGATDISGSVAPRDVAHWRKVTEAALAIEIDTPRTFKESVDVFRIGRREIEANPDGIALGGAMIESLALLGQFDRRRAMDQSSSGFKQGRASVLLNTATAMGHVWMVTKTNTRRDQIAAGADWLRINLKATLLGLAFQPLSQALQEYPEMKAHYDATHRTLAPGGGTVQMLARIGYGPEVPPSPRWPLEAKLARRTMT